MSLKSAAYMGALAIGLSGCTGHHNSQQALQQVGTDSRPSRKIPMYCASLPRT